LDETHGAQTPNTSTAGSHRNQEGKHGVDQHAVAEEAQGTVLLGQYAKGNLGDDIAIEEGRQDVALQS